MCSESVIVCLLKCVFVFACCFLQLRVTPLADSIKAEPSEVGPSNTASSPKESLSPGTEGEMSSSSWVVDGSGFLSPAGPALKEVLDMVDGVRVPSNHGTQSEMHLLVAATQLGRCGTAALPHVSSATRTLKVGVTSQPLTCPRRVRARSATSFALRAAPCRS